MKVDSALAGKQARCPNCKNQFQIPHRTNQPAKSPAPRPSKTEQPNIPKAKQVTPRRPQSQAVTTSNQVQTKTQIKSEAIQMVSMTKTDMFKLGFFGFLGASVASLALWLVLGLVFLLLFIILPGVALSLVGSTQETAPNGSASSHEAELDGSGWIRNESEVFLTPDDNGQVFGHLTPPATVTVVDDTGDGWLRVDSAGAPVKYLNSHEYMGWESFKDKKLYIKKENFTTEPPGNWNK
ncbi:MAG: hypothetical protein COA78_12885 [Blastopirellula sp.]|nr:MAG: hypothetical protein COA78_12885 [Blastopirellula sp.]